MVGFDKDPSGPLSSTSMTWKWGWDSIRSGGGGCIFYGERTGRLATEQFSNFFDIHGIQIGRSRRLPPSTVKISRPP